MRTVMNALDRSGVCWLWTGPTLHNGYGKARGGRAHRLAWSEANGPIPPGMMVLHSCDNRLCCRPDHLRLGSARDNTHDMLRKRRQYASKLSEETAAEIRAWYATGCWTQRELAEAFGISQTSVSKTARGVSWVYAPGPLRHR